MKGVKCLFQIGLAIRTLSIGRATRIVGGVICCQIMKSMKSSRLSMSVVSAVVTPIIV